jgi:hypothetical protein
VQPLISPRPPGASRALAMRCMRCWTFGGPIPAAARRRRLRPRRRAWPRLRDDASRPGPTPALPVSQDSTRVGRGARGCRPAPRAPRPRAKCAPRAPRPRAPLPKWASWVTQHPATHPAQLNWIAGCAARPARPGRRRARRDARATAASSGVLFRDGPGSVTTVLASRP